MAVRETCGTYGGYQTHKRYGEEPCRPCRDASNAYARQYRKVQPTTVKLDRLQAKVRARALSKLAEVYPDDFQQLYAAEITSVESEIDTLLRKLADERATNESGEDAIA